MGTCSEFFFIVFNDTATTEIYTLSLHDALPICSHASSTGDWKNASSSWGTEDGGPWQGGPNPGQMGKMACVTLNRNLGPGSQGDDVKKLQMMLSQDPSLGFNASATGVFGPM